MPVVGNSYPTVFLVRCPNLCDPNNGAVDFYDTTVGSVAMYTCNEGFNLSGAVNRDCQANGTWSPSEPICIPVGKYTYCQDLDSTKSVCKLLRRKPSTLIKLF